jgi:hypothetical protein
VIAERLARIGNRILKAKPLMADMVEGGSRREAWSYMRMHRCVAGKLCLKRSKKRGLSVVMVGRGARGADRTTRQVSRSKGHQQYLRDVRPVRCRSPLAAVDKASNSIVDISCSLVVHVGIGRECRVLQGRNVGSVLIAPFGDAAGDRVHAALASGKGEELLPLRRPDLLGGRGRVVSPSGAPTCLGKWCPEPVEHGKILVLPGLLHAEANPVAGCLSDSFGLLFTALRQGSELVFKDPQSAGHSGKAALAGIASKLCPKGSSVP